MSNILSGLKKTGEELVRTALADAEAALSKAKKKEGQDPGAANPHASSFDADGHVRIPGPRRPVTNKLLSVGIKESIRNYVRVEEYKAYVKAQAKRARLVGDIEDTYGIMADIRSGDVKRRARALTKLSKVLEGLSADDLQGMIDMDRLSSRAGVMDMLKAVGPRFAVRRGAASPFAGMTHPVVRAIHERKRQQFAENLRHGRLLSMMRSVVANQEYVVAAEKDKSSVRLVTGEPIGFIDSLKGYRPVSFFPMRGRMPKRLSSPHEKISENELRWQRVELVATFVHELKRNELIRPIVRMAEEAKELDDAERARMEGLVSKLKHLPPDKLVERLPEFVFWVETGAMLAATTRLEKAAADIQKGHAKTADVMRRAARVMTFGIADPEKMPEVDIAANTGDVRKHLTRARELMAKKEKGKLTSAEAKEFVRSLRLASLHFDHATVWAKEASAFIDDAAPWVTGVSAVITLEAIGATILATAATAKTGGAAAPTVVKSVALLKYAFANLVGAFAFTTVHTAGNVAIMGEKFGHKHFGHDLAWNYLTFMAIGGVMHGAGAGIGKLNPEQMAKAFEKAGINYSSARFLQKLAVKYNLPEGTKLGEALVTALGKETMLLGTEMATFQGLETLKLAAAAHGLTTRERPDFGKAVSELWGGGSLLHGLLMIAGIRGFNFTLSRATGKVRAHEIKKLNEHLKAQIAFLEKGEMGGRKLSSMARARLEKAIIGHIGRIGRLGGAIEKESIDTFRKLIGYDEANRSIEPTVRSTAGRRLSLSRKGKDIVAAAGAAFGMPFSIAASWSAWMDRRLNEVRSRFGRSKSDGTSNPEKPARDVDSGDTAARGPSAIRRRARQARVEFGEPRPVQHTDPQDSGIVLRDSEIIYQSPPPIPADAIKKPLDPSFKRVTDIYLGRPKEWHVRDGQRVNGYSVDPHDSIITKIITPQHNDNPSRSETWRSRVIAGTADFRGQLPDVDITWVVVKDADAKRTVLKTIQDSPKVTKKTHRVVKWRVVTQKEYDALDSVNEAVYEAMYDRNGKLIGPKPSDNLSVPLIGRYASKVSKYLADPSRKRPSFKTPGYEHLKDHPVVKHLNDLMDFPQHVREFNAGVRANLAITNGIYRAWPEIVAEIEGTIQRSKSYTTKSPVVPYILERDVVLHSLKVSVNQVAVPRKGKPPIPADAGKTGVYTRKTKATPPPIPADARRDLLPRDALGLKKPPLWTPHSPPPLPLDMQPAAWLNVTPLPDASSVRAGQMLKAAAKVAAAGGTIAGLIYLGLHVGDASVLSAVKLAWGLPFFLLGAISPRGFRGKGGPESKPLSAEALTRGRDGADMVSPQSIGIPADKAEVIRRIATLEGNFRRATDEGKVEIARRLVGYYRALVENHGGSRTLLRIRELEAEHLAGGSGGVRAVVELASLYVDQWNMKVVGKPTVSPRKEDIVADISFLERKYAVETPSAQFMIKGWLKSLYAQKLGLHSGTKPIDQLSPAEVKADVGKLEDILKIREKTAGKVEVIYSDNEGGEMCKVEPMYEAQPSKGGLEGEVLRGLQNDLYVRMAHAAIGRSDGGTVTRADGKIVNVNEAGGAIGEGAEMGRAALIGRLRELEAKRGGYADFLRKTIIDPQIAALRASLAKTRTAFIKDGESTYLKGGDVEVYWSNGDANYSPGWVVINRGAEKVGYFARMTGDTVDPELGGYVVKPGEFKVMPDGAMLFPNPRLNSGSLIDGENVHVLRERRAPLPFASPLKVPDQGESEMYSTAKKEQLRGEYEKFIKGFFVSKVPLSDAEILQHNRESLRSEEAIKEWATKRIGGGKAGRNCLTMNAYVDDQGRIIRFGNVQSVPEAIVAHTHSVSFVIDVFNGMKIEKVNCASGLSEVAQKRLMRLAGYGVEGK